MMRRIVTIGIFLAAALVLLAVPAVRHGLQGLIGGSETAVSDDTYWTCPMHPEIRLPQKGDCPICGMSLVEKHGDGDERGTTVTVTPQQVQLTGVTAAPVTRRNLAREISAYGTIDYDETHLAVVSAWVGGRIDKLFVDFTGVTVEKGHALVSLYSPDLISAAEEHALAIRSLASARATGNPAAIKPAQDLADASRQRLLRWGLTEKQVDDIAEGKSVGDHIMIYAPQGGTVLERMAYEGMYVNQGDVLFRVADLSTVWLSAEIYEDDIPYLYEQRAGDYFVCPMHPEVTSRRPGSCPKCGMELIRTNDDVAVEISTRAFPGEVFHGKVAFTDPVLNPETRTVRVRVNIENHDFRLKPNMYARASIKLPLGEMLSVPENAVLQSGSRTLVLVEEAQGTFRPQPVVLGRMWLDEANPPVEAKGELAFKRTASRYHEVLDGLAEGDRVVTSGNFLIGSESQLQGALAKMLGDEVHAVTPPAPGGGEPVAAPKARRPAPDASLDVVRARKMLDAYDTIATALAADKLDGVGNAALAIMENAPNDVIRRAAAPLEHAEHAGKIDETRQQFVALSTAVLDYVAVNRAPIAAALGDAMPRKAYCPMYPGPWLQRGDDIVNPYYGSEMLHCGEFKPLEASVTE
ncbi:MAG TPA: efflux RND transporter periplasmic adaptor subunit [Candidatus Krumholzibacteria bacterium]|nr:efflux RND transporter periplasmic adaptor subunit [Candidatus Krumholzibacteria bacterium]